MKRNHVICHPLKTIVKTVFAVLFLSIVTVAGVTAQSAATTSSPPDMAMVTYLGNTGGLMSFGVKYDNISGEKYAVTVLDADGNILYKDIFTDRKFNKTIKAPEEIGNLSFIISNPKNSSDKKFEVSTQRRLVEEVSVTRLH